MSKQSNARVSAKIRILKAEGRTQRQAVGAALGMEREGRIRNDGSYIRAGRKSGRR